MTKTQTLYVNNGRTTLGSTITTSSVSFTVSNPAVFPTSLTSGQFFYVTLFDTVNIEIVKVTAVSGSTFTVVRAQEGTTAYAFTAAVTTVENRLTAADLTNFARIDDHMATVSGIDQLTAPTTMNGNSYVIENIPTAGGSILVALADTTNNVWSFTSYPVKIVATTAGAGATSTVINWSGSGGFLTDQTAGAYIVQFTSGALQGQARFISSNTGTTFTVSVPFSAAPGSSDSYSIYRHVGENVTAEVDHLRQFSDTTYITAPAVNYVNGDKRLVGGNFQMYNGTSWNNYVLNYVPSTAAAIGSYTIAGSNGGYAGFDFSGAYHNQSFIASATVKSSGVYSASDTAWDWRWDAGVLAVGTVPYANLSGTPNLSVYAPIANPTFTGVPAGPTAANGTNTTQLATTAFVHNSTVTVTGSATSGSKTYVTSGLIEQWMEQVVTSAGNSAVTITYPVAFTSTYGVPRITATNLYATNPAVNNFVGVTVQSYSASGCVVYVGSVPTGSGTITITVDVKGT